MHIPTLLVAVAIEVYIALLVASIVLLWYLRKQKKLIHRQQQKLLELIEEIKNQSGTPKSPSAPEKNYKYFINEHLNTTQSHFETIAPTVDITEIQPLDSDLDQRVIALRYAFLRAEELGTTEEIGSPEYWNIFQQTLEPLLPQESTGENLTAEELETYKKRVSNLEKFKKLYFELEEKWNAAQNTAQDYYNQITSLVSELDSNENLSELLNDYNNTYLDLNHDFNNISYSASGGENKTINIIRQDPRAAEEIVKLRNVAADQHRIINNLQRKLNEASSDQERVLIVQELEQQLQRQIRFVQESDTCIKLLEEELAQANDKIARQEIKREDEQQIEEENQKIKETLQSFTLESKELVSNLNDLERENLNLRENLQQQAGASNKLAPEVANKQLEQIQTDFAALQKQYAELEEKYLNLKLK